MIRCGDDTSSVVRSELRYEQIVEFMLEPFHYLCIYRSLAEQKEILMLMCG